MTIDLAKSNGSSPPIKAWFDGGYDPNRSGRRVWGVVIEVNGRTVVRKFGYVGCGTMMSSNVAEYGGCIAALEELANCRGHAVVYGDSQLVIQQLLGVWGVKKGGLYVPYFEKAKSLLQTLSRERVKFEKIRSKENQQAHNLSRHALLNNDLKPGDQEYLLRAYSGDELTVADQQIRQQTLDHKQDQFVSLTDDPTRAQAILSERKEAYADQL